MSPKLRALLWDYSVAILSVACATALRLLLDPWLQDKFPFATLFLAVLLSAWSGGLGPGVAATLAGAIASTTLLLPARHGDDAPVYVLQAGLFVYLFVSLGIAFLGERMRTARLRAEVSAAEAARNREELARSEARYRQMLETAHEGVWVADAETRTTFVNRRMAEILGATQEDMLGRLARDFLFPEDQSILAARLLRRKAGLREESDLRLRRADGTEVWVHVSASPLFEGAIYTGSMGLCTDITSRRDAERALREQREWFEVTLSSIGDAVIATGMDGTIKFLNTVAQDLTGWTKDEAVGQPLDRVYRILNEHTRASVESPVEKALREGRVVGLANHTILIARDGTERPIDDSAAPIQDEHDRIVGVVLIFRDVTEQRGAEEVRRLLAAIVTSSEDAIIGKDLDGRITSWNEGAVRVYGYQARAVLGQPFSILVPPDRSDEVAEGAGRLRRGERLEHFETVRLRADGTLIDVSVSYSPIKDDNGRLIGTAVITRDISARKQSETALRESEERLRLALEAGKMGVWDWNIPTDAVRWSDNLEPMHGLAPGTFGGTFQAYQELIYVEDRALVHAAIARALDGRSGYDLEFRNVWPDGSLHWMAGKGRVFTDEQDRPARMIGIGMDVTQRKRAEHNAQFLADASAALAGLVDVDSALQNVARLAVPRFADWCAVDAIEEGATLRRVAVAHQDQDQDPVELAHELHEKYPPDPNAAQGLWHVLRTGKSELISEFSDSLMSATIRDMGQREMGQRDKLRTLGLRSYLAVPLSVRGKVLGVLTFVTAESGRHYTVEDLAVAEDLAHRAAVALENARLYQEVREADRRKDEFLAVLGHELRNPLAPISNALHLLKMPGAKPQVVEQAREMMERQIQHMVRLVDDLLDVSRIVRGKVELRCEPLELSAVVARAVETVQPLLEAEGHKLSVELPVEPLCVQGDLVRLAQILGNLLHNAARYTERGGEIRIVAKRVGDQAALSVLDNGIGISPENLPRIWDMFAQADRRLKGSQGGMGIGLALVKGLVERHGGTVAARSAGLGQGSEFVITLPLRKDCENDDAQSAADRPPAPAVARRVLIVDDNVDAARSLAMLLRIGGHEVRVAHDGRSAMQLAEAHVPEVAFVDIGMPVMDGYQLAQHFKGHPELRSVMLVALTGWGQDLDRARTREAGFDAHEVKPISLTALDKLLNQPRPQTDPCAED